MRSELAREARVELATGDVVAGTYRVSRVLGRGATGLVVLAVHEVHKQLVAIKVLRPTRESDPESIARFLFEAKAACQLKSAHTARVFEVSTLDDGSPYFVMEYLEGLDLGAALKRSGAFPLETGVNYLLQVCEALAEAHAAGIVHRDLKPTNIFLAETPDGPTQAMLLDFGISKQPAPGGETELRSTRTQAIVGLVGSPHYMAPEQTRSTRRVDHRADIWSLGVVLQEMLTGQRPFSGRSLAEVSAAVAVDDPVLCRSQRPDLPEEIEAIVLRCLEKEPLNRYLSVAELASALAPFAPREARVALAEITRALERATNVTAPPPASDLASRLSIPGLRPPGLPTFSASRIASDASPPSRDGAVTAPPPPASTPAVIRDLRPPSVPHMLTTSLVAEAALATTQQTVTARPPPMLDPVLATAEADAASRLADDHVAREATPLVDAPRSRGLVPPAKQAKRWSYALAAGAILLAASAAWLLLAAPPSAARAAANREPAGAPATVGAAASAAPRE